MNEPGGADRLAPGEIAPLRPPPGAALFSRRAARLGALARGHAAGDYLAFLERLAAAQVEACERVAVPSGELQARPPPAWREALAAILSGLEAAPGPQAAHAAMARLRRLSVPELDALAERLRAGEAGQDDAAITPFVGAALQVVYTSWAARRPAPSAAASPPVPEARCPVCGAPPVAAVVLGDDRLRYLVCSLCGTEWHRTRVQCATCGESSGLTYLGIEDRGKAVKAEACSHCRTFLKIFYLEEDPKAEPFADDVATLALDLLVADEGYARGGVSCFWS